MAERNFDEEFGYDQAEGHSFTLGGYTFRTRAVAPPGAFLNAGRGLAAAVRFLRAVVIPEDRADLERVMEMGDSSGNLLDHAPDLLAAAALVVASQGLDDPERRTQALTALSEVMEKCSQPDEPGTLVSAHEVDVAADWLMEVTIGRPTNSPSSSGNGAGRTSGGSKGVSSKAARAGKT